MKCSHAAARLEQLRDRRNKGTSRRMAWGILEERTTWHSGERYESSTDSVRIPGHRFDHRPQSRMIQRVLGGNNRGAATYVTAPASHQCTPAMPPRGSQAVVCTIPLRHLLNRGQQPLTMLIPHKGPDLGRFDGLLRTTFDEIPGVTRGLRQ